MSGFIQRCLLGGSLGADFLGTTITGDAQGERLLSITPAKVNYKVMDQTRLGEISHEKAHENNHCDNSNSEEGIETDFLISPGDVYPNRKVKLEEIST